MTDSTLPEDNESTEADPAVQAADSDHEAPEQTGPQDTAGGDGTDEGQLQDQLNEANDRVLRAQAELENVRRRTRRELEEQRKYANYSLLQDLLPVVDNLNRAIESAANAEDVSGVVDGVQLVATQLVSVLERHHCQEIAAKGEKFDPNLHEAIAEVPTNDAPPGTVVDVAVRGYQLHDRVLRASQVLVSKSAE